MKSILPQNHTEAIFSISKKLVFLLLFFLVIANHGYGQLLTEKFPTTIPATWAVESNLTPASNWAWDSASGYQPTGFTDTGCAMVNPGLNTTTGQTAEYYLITKQFVVPVNGNIRFYTKQGSYSNFGSSFQVRISTSNQINSFITLQTYTEATLNVAATTYQENVVPIPASIVPGTQVYVAFVEAVTQAGTTATKGDSWFIDNVRVVGACPAVTTPTITATADGALITWTHPVATNFHVDVVPTGAGHGTVGTVFTGTASPFTYTVTGLSANTSYDFCIVADCDAETSSQWACFTFKTPTVGVDCSSPIIIPDVTTNGTYILADNIMNYNNVGGPTYTTQGSSCLPAGVTNNYLLGSSKIFFTYTPTKTGLITITQNANATNVTPCYNNLTGVFVYDDCSKIGVECLAGLRTNDNNPQQIPNFLVQAGHTYYIVMGTPFAPSASGVQLCFTFKVEGSTCPPPSSSAMTYNHLTTNSASFSWDNVGNLVSQWQYLAKPAVNGAPNGTDAFVTTSSIIDQPLTGLTAGTAYNFYVRSVCGGTPGAWSDAFPFTTQCNPVAIPYYTGFQGASVTNPEPCWTSVNLNHDDDFFTYAADLVSANKTAKLSLTIAKSTTNDMLVTPSFVLDGAKQKRIRFSVQPYPFGQIGNLDPGGPGTNQNVYATFKVKVSVTGIGDETHDFIYEIQPVKTVSLYDTPGYQYIFTEQRVVIPANIVGTANVAIILPPGYNQSASSIYIDDVYIEDMPDCPEPYLPKVIAGSVTATSAQLAWNNGYQENQWEVAVQTRGTGMPTGNGIAVTTNPFTATNLVQCTRYEYYVRAVCSVSKKSEWVGPVYFDTPCVDLSLPFCESFNDDDLTTKKFGWTTNNADNNVSKWVMGTTEPTMSLAYSINPDTGFNDWLISPPLTSASSGAKDLKFDCRAAVSPVNFTAGYGVQVLISTTDTNPSSFTEVVPLFIGDNTSYITKEFLIPSVGTGIFYVAFRVPPTMTTNFSGLQVDNICITDLVACPKPKDLTTTNVLSNAATLSWTLGYQETKWEVAIQKAGIGTPANSGVAVSITSTYSATGLLSGTDYEYYVRAVCGADKSEWVGPYAFSTFCDPFPTPFKETFDSDSTTKKCWRINNQNGDTAKWSTQVTVNAISGDQMAGIFDGTNGKNDDWLISPTLTVKPNQRIRFKYKTYSNQYNEDIKVKMSTNGTDTAQFTNTLYENSIYTTTDAAGVVAGATTVTLTSNPGVRIGDYIDTDGIDTGLYQDDSGARVTAINGLTISFDIPAYGSCTSSNGSTTCVNVPGGNTISFTHDLIHNTTEKELVINLPSVTSTQNVNFAIQIPYYPTRFTYKGQYVFIDDFIVEDIPACPPPTNIVISEITDTSAKVDWTPTGTETQWQISLQPYGTAAPVGNALPAYLKDNITAHPYAFTGLTPATKYQYYVRAKCSVSSQSAWVGPFELTTRCSSANACQYTIILDDVIKSQPAGTVDVIQNGLTVQQLQFPNSTIPSDPNMPLPAQYQVFLCSGAEFSLYWNATSADKTYINCTVTVKDVSGNIVFTGMMGDKPRKIFYTGYSSCGTVTCPRPINLTASNLSVLSWTKGGSETQWEVAIQPAANGTIPQSGHVVSSPNYTPVAGDFLNLNNTTYEYFVRAICGASNTSSWSGPYIFVRNDDSSTAVTAYVNSGDTCDIATNVSFIHATASSEPTSCTGVNGGDVWLDFVATSKIHNIELNNFTPGSYYYGDAQTYPFPKIILSLYEILPNGTLLEKGCSETNSFTTWYSSELVVGKTYKLRLKLNDMVPNTKYFDVCVTTPNQCDVNAINYDFEHPRMQSVTGTNSIITRNVVSGWGSNVSYDYLFYQDSTNNLPPFPTYSGGQMIQLIGTDSATYNPNVILGLYRDFDTSEITQMDYSFANATRSTNGDSVQLYAGPPNGPYTLVTERSATNTVWKLEKGSYTVPSGQPTTRFIFRPKDNVVGHLLDAANFKPNNSILTAENTTISCGSQTLISINALGKGVWSADANNPAATSIASPNSNATTISGFNTVGTYVYHWKTRYCDKTMTVNYQDTAVPLTASISGTASICPGTSTVITFNGTPNAMITYTNDGSVNQTIALNATGTATLITQNLTVNSTYDLVSVASSSGCSQDLTGSAMITILSGAYANVVSELTVFDTPYDGIAVFDLTTKNTGIIGSQTGMEVIYYSTLANAQADVNPIPNPLAYANSSNPQTIYAKVISISNPTGCSAVTSFKIRVLDPNIVYIPDADFKAKLIALGVDTNADGEIQVSEALVITSLDVSYANIADLTGINTFVNLTTLFVSNNVLTMLDVSALPVLSYLNCTGNQLMTLGIKNGIYTVCYASNNPFLKFVCADESEVESTKQINGNNIVVSSYCSFTPGGSYNTITGNVRFDANNNGCDSNDVSKSKIRIDINDGIESSASFTNLNGDYNFYTQTGSFALTPSFENPAWFIFAPATATVSYADTNNNITTQNFCLAANGVHSDVEVVIAPIGTARPGFYAYYKVVYENKGNQMLSGNVNFAFDNDKLDYISATTNPDTQTSGGLLTWNYINLLPFESRTFNITLKVNGPIATPPVNIGDHLIFNATINPITDDELPVDNQFSYNQTVIGSYDPNEITCIEGDSVPSSEIGNYLHYIINFENTGTDDAENIVVKDIIDITKYDINSLQILDSSNDVDARITGNVAEFIFKKIKLHSGGHGNILLKIKSLNTLHSGDTVIKNADIFFDYNAPVTTNDASTIYQSLGVNENNIDSLIVIYPNPAKNNVTINCNTNIKSVELFDVQGRLLQTKLTDEIKTTIDISERSNGLYLLKVTSEKGVKVEKIVKE